MKRPRVRLTPSLVAAGAVLLALLLAPRVLADSSRADLESLLTIAAGPQDPEFRKEAIAELAERAGVDAIPELLRIGFETWEVRRATWAAATRIVVRSEDRPSYERLSGMLPGLPHESRARLLSCIADAGSPLGIPVLARAARFSADLAPVAISGLERLPGAAENEEALLALRELLTADRPTLRRDAVRALGRFGDEESLDQMVVLLGGESAAVKEEAHWALREVTGLEIPPDDYRWKAWLAMERRWWESQGEECMKMLESRDSSMVIRAINELGAHFLHRDRVDHALAGLLEHPNPTVVAAVMAARNRANRDYTAVGGGGGGVATVGGGASFSPPEARGGTSAFRPKVIKEPPPPPSMAPSWVLWLVGGVLAVYLMLRVLGFMGTDSLRSIFKRG